MELGDRLIFTPAQLPAAYRKRGADMVPGKLFASSREFVGEMLSFSPVPTLVPEVGLL